MPFTEDLKQLLETEEINTVSDAFGGSKTTGRTLSFSVSKIRDWILQQVPYSGDSEIESILNDAQNLMSNKLFRIVLASNVRFSFLIELTNLALGSTKMKTRWLPGYILMPQENSFEPISGLFQPGNDPRAASFDDCLGVFEECISITCNHFRTDSNIQEILPSLDRYNSVPYEFPIDYVDASRDPVHQSNNIQWILNDDLLWLLKARRILSGIINQQEMNKIRTKTYKTDRSLTGKDKTNRAKRWEVLSGDFQHASITDCWSVERTVLAGLICFESFPSDIKNRFIAEGLISKDAPVTKCPVTLLPLDYNKLVNAAIHGISEYQIGHLRPLKRAGKHRGDNICWQSFDGNRIQGNLTIEETITLIQGIARRISENTTS